MSVTNGQAANQTTFNSAFVSKTATSGNSVDGKIDLANTDAESGDSISNVQKEINNKTYKVNSTEIVSSGAQITVSSTKGMQLFPVISDGGNVTMNIVPFAAGASFLDGTQIRLIGTSDTDSVTISNNDNADGAILNGSITLTKYVQITLIYVNSLSRWIEIGRNS